MVWLGVAVGFTVSVLVSWTMLFVGRRLEILDRPDGRLKTQTGATVPLGGAALMLGLHSGLAVAGGMDVGLLVSTAGVFAMGLVDDIKGLSPQVRLLGGAVAGVLLVTLSDLVDGWLPGMAAVILVIVAMNAVNLIDGLDGLAASVTALACVGLGLYGSILGVPEPWLPVMMTGALAGVLTLNWPPARLYLGDNGAYVIGVTLAWAVLRATSDWGVGLVGAALIGYPLIDLTVTVVRRLRQSEQVFAGDREHTYDRLDRRLSSPVVVVFSVLLLQALWSGSIIAALSFGGVAAAFAVSAVLGLGAVFVGLVTA